MHIHASLFWYSDAMLRPDKMLLSMPEEYTVRCGCKSKCPKWCKCKNTKIDCIEFCKCKELHETWRNISKNIFWQNWRAAIKKKKVVMIFAVFFLYVYYDFVLVLFPYRIYLEFEQTRKSQNTFFIFYSNWHQFLKILSSLLVCLIWNTHNKWNLL